MRCLIVLVILILLLPCVAGASTITLQWDPETAPDLAGYKVYYSTTNTIPFDGTGATQGPSPVDVGLGTIAGQDYSGATITGLDAGQAYYFAVTAYNSAGVESPYSNIVMVPELIPPTVTAVLVGNVLTATATDNVGVTKVEFYANGTLLSTSTSPPYTVTIPAGASWFVVAYDAAGNGGTNPGSPWLASWQTYRLSWPVHIPNCTIKGSGGQSMTLRGAW
jgi:chitinase